MLSFDLTSEDRITALTQIDHLLDHTEHAFTDSESLTLKSYISRSINEGALKKNVFGHHPILHAIETAILATEEMGLRKESIIAILLYPCMAGQEEIIKESEYIRNNFGEVVFHIIKGLVRIQELYTKNPIIESENFRNLLLSFAEDMRVILIMIADRVHLMRIIKDNPNTSAKIEVSKEAAYLYAPLAHKLGLYKLKSELEDLSLKYLEAEAYYMIKEKLNATKRARDQYIEEFITPISTKLEEAGLKFQMKGRTKSIHSIWQKMKKQNCDYEGIYDLFAIRIIIDAPPEKEKMQCWQAYSIITDMYQPNPKRLRDWLSVPKSNGYESLHITVLGQHNKWVEVQIRTERMDEVAEKGLAAHWRYKGIKTDNGMDEWLNNIREALENNDDLQLMDQFKMDLCEDEVFVFTPKGELYKFPKGATVLDFAYHIHTGVGNKCTGARINMRNVPIKHILQSGEQLEIITNNNQQPKRDWLNIVKTSRAKTKIKLALKETQNKDAGYAKELIKRRFKNRKIDLDDRLLNVLIKKLGYKEITEFYHNLAEEKIDINDIIDKYIILQDSDSPNNYNNQSKSASEYTFNKDPDTGHWSPQEDVLIIDRHLKGIKYTTAQCCKPIYGDPIFGFISINKGIKIHRINCPNAPMLRERYGYRIVKAKWSGKGTAQYSTTLKVIGKDDLGIVNNITGIIAKEEKITTRSINIDSDDGLFTGTIIVQLDDTAKLESLIRKLKNIKGVKQVERI